MIHWRIDMEETFVIEDNDEFTVYQPTSDNQESIFGLTGNQKKKKLIINKQNKKIMRLLNENVDENKLLIECFNENLTLYDYWKSDVQYVGVILKPIFIKDGTKFPEDVRFRIMIEDLDRHIVCNPNTMKILLEKYDDNISIQVNSFESEDDCNKYHDRLNEKRK